MPKYWTEPEINKLKELMGKTSFEEMTKQFAGRTKMALVHKADKLGLSNTYRYRKHFFNIDFWKTPNLVNSYFGGYAAADGYINHSSFVFSLATRDAVVLEKFKEVTDFTGNIRHYQRKNYKKETLKSVSTLFINTVDHWRDDLKNNFGVINKKTLILQPPNLTNELLILAYIIGYIDGDGWIILKKDNRPILGVVSGSYDFIFWVKRVLDKYFPIGIRKDKGNKISQGTKLGEKKNCFYFVFSGSRAAKMIDFLRQFPIFKLDRKWNNPAILARIEEMKQQYPNFFILSPELQNIKNQLLEYKNPSASTFSVTI
ncbi:MAG: hypothetical protein AABY22_30995 [Nanoarchaeota archaeon]